MPAVGAIRWDAWFPGNEFQRNLAPKQWHYRLPFYTDFAVDGTPFVISDRQDVMEKEVALARDAGLDYWAFVYSADPRSKTAERFNYGVRRFTAVPDKRGLKFCIILLPDQLGPKKQWALTMAELVKLFKDPAYMKVMGGRPLVYIFNAAGLSTWAGSDEAAKAAFDELDEATLKAGLQEPYDVAQSTSATSASWLANRFGLDAVSAYTAHGTGEDAEHPFRDLADENRRFWDDCKMTAKQIIPIVNVGWDNRPRRTSTEQQKVLRGPWYLPPAPDELTRHLSSAIQWVKDNPEYTEAQTVIIYAWNEHDEGGWLVPTLAEGSARLEAVKAALHRR